MKSYPSIGREVTKSPIYAFDKLDGSNIRCEWSKKKGFWKFGSRNVLLDRSHPDLGEAVDLIIEKYEEELSGRLKATRAQKAICFFEFFGENSFAGVHTQEQHDVVLFDVSLHQKGIMPPKDYLKFSEGLSRADLLYHGNPNEDFLTSVKKGKLEGMSFEGVICKSNELLSPGLPKMFKVKNELWIEELSRRYRDDPALIQKLL